MKRLALLAGLTLALATPAHAGKRNKKKAPDLTDWLTLAEDMGVRVQAGQFSVDDPALAVQQATAFLQSHGMASQELDLVADLAVAGLGLQPTKKGKKKRKGKKKKQNTSATASSGARGNAVAIRR